MRFPQPLAMSERENPEEQERRRNPPYKKQHGFLYNATVGAVKKATRPSWHRGMSDSEWRRRERVEA